MSIEKTSSNVAVAVAPAGSKRTSTGVQKTNKKQTNNQKLKCILAQPFEKYWPKLETNDIEELKEIFEEDKTMIENFNAHNYIQENDINFGLTACLRDLKAGSLSAVFLSTEIRPHYIISRIINYVLARSENSDNNNSSETNSFITKIFCIDNLSEITTQLFGINTNAISFTQNKFKKLDDFVRNLSKKFPVPNSILNYYSNIKSKSAKNDFNKIHKELQNKKNDNFVEKVDFEKIYLLKKPPSDNHDINETNSNDLVFRLDSFKKFTPVITDDENEFSDDFISISTNDNNNSKSNTPKNVISIEANTILHKEKKRKIHDIIQNAIHNNSTKNLSNTSTDTLMDIDLHGNKIEIIEKSDKKIKSKKEKKYSIKINKKLLEVNQPDCGGADVIYKPLIVYKVKPNPNKKRKPKKKKNK